MLWRLTLALPLGGAVRTCGGVGPQIRLQRRRDQFGDADALQCSAGLHAPVEIAGEGDAELLFGVGHIEQSLSQLTQKSVVGCAK